MTNLEKIKSMTPREFAKFLCDNGCDETIILKWFMMEVSK